MGDTKSQPRPRGRPATGQTPKRYFRMGDDEWAFVQQAANAKGKTVSAFVRDTILRAARRVVK